MEEAALDQPALFWSICSTLQKMFVANRSPQRAMIELGLVEAMVNVLQRLCGLWRGVGGKGVHPPDYSLLECWISFAQSIITSILPYKWVDGGCQLVVQGRV